MDETLQAPVETFSNSVAIESVKPAKRRQRRAKLDPAVIEKEYEVLKYRRGGMTFDQIAQKVGYATPSGAQTAYKRAMVRTLQPVADELRETQLDRLETALMAIWNKVLKGDLKAIDRLIAISRRQSELLGMDAPKQAQVEVTTYDGTVLRERAQQIIQIIREHGNTQG
jgi:AraC-like DNA-binding protein